MSVSDKLPVSGLIESFKATHEASQATSSERVSSRALGPGCRRPQSAEKAPTSREVSCSRMILLFSEYGVHHPATAHVVNVLVAVRKNGWLVAPCVLQSIGQKGQTIERTFLVDGLGNPDHR